jgi:hypothetical protein
MGLDFLVLTDHDTLDQTRDPEFFSTPEVGLLPGCEWTDIAHGGAVGIRSLPPRIDRSRDPATWVSQVQARIDATHSEGGAWILYHPTWNHTMWFLPVRDFDAVEVWNSFWTVMDIGLNPTDPADLQQRLDQYGFSAAGVAPSPEIVAAVSSQGGGNDRALFFWEEFLERGERVAAVGGSDRHDLLLPGYPTTWVLSPSRDQADLMAAVRAGRTMVTEGPQGPRVDFTADGDGDGIFEAVLGDDVPAGGAMVSFRVRIAGARTGLMRVMRRRTVIYETLISAADEVFQFADIPRRGDWYRVDVFLPVDWSLPSANLALLPFAGANGGLSPALSLFGVSLMLGTNKPVIDLEERYRRILNVSHFDRSWSRAAITSPIYTR